MTISVYQQGDFVRVDIEFRNEAGALVDPSTHSLKVTTPAGVTTEYVFGVAVELVRDSLGVFHGYIDVLAQGGRWLYRWESTGTAKAAQEALFMCEPSDFAVTP
jgi:hypothetical protein